MHTQTRQTQHRLSLRDFAAAAAVALAFSAFIYLEHYAGISDKSLNSLLALGALYGLLVLNRRALLISGFFIGLLWFYWIGLSFRYYEMGWMIPLVSIGFGFVYMLYFGVMALNDAPWLRASLLLLTGYLVEPFGFNWMQPPLLFVESWFGTAWWQFALIVLVLSVVASLRGKERFLLLTLLLLAADYESPRYHPLDLKYKLVSTDVAQEEKWLPWMRTPQVEYNLREIDRAIAQGYETVILPESAFPLYMNHDEDLRKALLERSKQIAIVTGALYEEDGRNYNVTYYFHDGRHEMAKKMVLVPFGEYIPLPEFARAFINDLFFDGASDYARSDRPTDFRIDGLPFRNAICYEATTESLYAGEPQFMIALSNNAWFLPSIEPTLQSLLIRYYARKHGTTVLHTTNGSGSAIIR